MALIDILCIATAHNDCIFSQVSAAVTIHLFSLFFRLPLRARVSTVIIITNNKINLELLKRSLHIRYVLVDVYYVFVTIICTIPSVSILCCCHFFFVCFFEIFQCSFRGSRSWCCGRLCFLIYIHIYFFVKCTSVHSFGAWILCSACFDRTQFSGDDMTNSQVKAYFLRLDIMLFFVLVVRTFCKIFLKPFLISQITHLGYFNLFI